jgi:hypothetical protein
LNARGVIVEATASFAITWQRTGGQIKWDQFAQKIELHASEVYPDLEYTEASARATYVKYVSAARINELLAAINQRIDLEMSTQNKPEDAGETPPKTDSTNQLLLPSGDPVNENDSAGSDLTVTVYGQKLKFIEGQRNTTTANAELLFRVSSNLQPELGGGGFDNTERIWAEVKTSTGTKRLEFKSFEEEVTKFGGNLLVQVLPSIEMRLKAKEDVYAYGDDDSTEVKVTKAVRADLEKLDDAKLKEIEDTILRIRNDRTAKKAKDIEAINQSTNK